MGFGDEWTMVVTVSTIFLRAAGTAGETDACDSRIETACQTIQSLNINSEQRGGVFATSPRRSNLRFGTLVCNSLSVPPCDSFRCLSCSPCDYILPKVTALQNWLFVYVNIIWVEGIWRSGDLRDSLPHRLQR